MKIMPSKAIADVASSACLELARDMNVKPAYGILSVLGQLQNIVDRLN
jgi:hypothetical protein